MLTQIGRVLLKYPLFNLLLMIYAIIPGHDFGVAVIILTFLVRMALWPLAAKQLHSQRALQQLAPEVAKIRAKAKGDRQKESQMLMELYKEKKINPAGSLGLALVQLPILLALFFVLRDIIHPGKIAELAYGFVKHLPVIKDVILNSAHFKVSLLGIVNLAKPNFVLALLAGVGQYFQTKQLTPRNADPKDPNARAMAITTVAFPLITVFIALSLPSALALYWATASIVAIAQQGWFLRQDVRELEEKG